MPRRPVEERIAEIDGKIQKLNDEISSVKAKKENLISSYDQKIANGVARIKDLEKKKEAILNPKPRTRRKTKKQKMNELLQQALKSGLSPEDLADKLGLTEETPQEEPADEQ